MSRYTISKSLSCFDLPFVVKQDGRNIAEFWHRDHAIIFKKAMEMKFKIKNIKKN